MNLWAIIAALSASMAREPELAIAASVPVVSPRDDAAHETPERAQLQFELRAAFGWFRRDVASPVLSAGTPEEARRALADVATIAAEARASLAGALGQLLHDRPDLVAEVTAPPQDAQRAFIEAQLGRRDAAMVLSTLDLAMVGTAELFNFLNSPHSAQPDAATVERAFAELVPLATRADVGLLIVLMGLHEPDLGASRHVLVALCDDVHLAVRTHRHALRTTLRRLDPQWFSAARRIAPAEAMRRLHAEVGTSMDALDPEAFLAEVRA